MDVRQIDAATLAEIKQHYGDNKLTVAQIGVRYGRSGTTISRLARTHGWPTRWERLGHAPLVRVPSIGKVRTALELRLCQAITTKLDQMEKDMVSGTGSSEDYGRDAKSVAAMIDGISKVASAGTHADKKPKRSSKAAAPDDASEAERISREIMERFERIQQRRRAEGAAE